MCDRTKRHRLLIVNNRSSPGGYFVPNDPWLQQRLAAIESFDGRSRQSGCAKLAHLLGPSSYQRYRLALLLDVFDAIDGPEGGTTSLREIARNVVYRHLDLGSAIEWKSSSQRRQVQRLKNEALFFVNGGYRRLLRCRIK